MRKIRNFLKLETSEGKISPQLWKTLGILSLSTGIYVLVMMSTIRRMMMVEGIIGGALCLTLGIMFLRRIKG